MDTSGLLQPGIEKILDDDHEEVKDILLYDSDGGFLRKIRELFKNDLYSDIEIEVKREYIKLLQKRLEEYASQKG